MAKFGINDILNAKTKAAGQQAQTDGYKEIYLSPSVFPFSMLLSVRATFAALFINSLFLCYTARSRCPSP